jgi:hypothetical protein
MSSTIEAASNSNDNISSKGSGGKKLSATSSTTLTPNLSPNTAARHNTNTATINNSTTTSNTSAAAASASSSNPSYTNSVAVSTSSSSTTATTTTTAPPPPQTSSTLTTTTLSYLNGIIHQQVSIDETPNKLLYKKVEQFMDKMQDETSGVPIKTVKSFMSKIPSVFTGTDLIQWIIKKIEVEDTCEALHFAHLVSSHGYIFPIDDHILTVKNDGTFFRFQVICILIFGNFNQPASFNA